MSNSENFQPKNLLCIRADNMGDLLMSTPALRALKETFGCKITVLTSVMGSLITPFISDISETLVADVPWIKTNKPIDEIGFAHLVQKLAGRAFDAAVIFTVYSQNPLPAAMLAFLAGIPVRVAYCRENPYQLLTHWLPDKEPYELIQHQVERDLQLVAALQAFPSSQQLSVSYSLYAKQEALQKLQSIGVDAQQPFIIFHPGVSEEKRRYPTGLWIKAGILFLQKKQTQIVITGSAFDELLVSDIHQGINSPQCFLAAGLFTIGELIAAVDMSHLLVSVNTGNVHIAAALLKPVVVLYALTNPQHTPWQTPCKVLYFSVEQKLESKNQVVRYVSDNRMPERVSYPSAGDVVEAIFSLLAQ